MDICGPHKTRRLRRVLHRIGVAVLAIGVEAWSNPECNVNTGVLMLFDNRRGRRILEGVAKLFKKFPSDYKSLPRFEAQAFVSFENDVAERAGGLMKMSTTEAKRQSV
jgi:hypothetical protein